MLALALTALSTPALAQSRVDLTRQVQGVLPIANGGTGSATGGLTASTPITSTVATGTAPLTVASTTQVANLNAGLLEGYSWSAPPIIGGSFASAAYFSTLSANSTITAGGQITSNVPNGTPPFIITSTTQVAHLNAASVNGFTFTAPGPIGTGGASSGTFTTIAGAFYSASSNSYTVPAGTTFVTQGASATSTLTLPAQTAGQMLFIRNTTAFAVVSATANVQPLTSGTAGTAILAAVAGKWALLVGNGTGWTIMAGN